MDPKTLIEVEDVLINRMTRWVSAFSTAPVIQMVVGRSGLSRLRLKGWPFIAASRPTPSAAAYLVGR